LQEMRCHTVEYLLAHAVDSVC